MWLSVFAGINLVGQALQAGALFMFMAGIVPTFRAFPVPSWLEMHRSMDADIDRFMPKLTVVTILAGLACQAYSQTGEQRVLRALGVLGSLVVVAVSEGVNVPINKVIKRKLASADGYVESEMADARVRWIAWHRYRTVASLLALVCLTAAMA
jgi:uncharacterized membrane protein